MKDFGTGMLAVLEETGGRTIPEEHGNVHFNHSYY